MLRYPGPRDYCGFEAPAEAHFDEPSLGGSLGPSHGEPLEPRLAVSGKLDDSRRADDGTPKITDFGLAKSSEKDLGLTKTNSILGSPSYMAPEQAEGQAKDVGPAADIYALGANLYELLTGRPPFVGTTILATLDLVKNAEPVSPRCLQPGVSADLETICLKCLRKEPERRYESADALADDLRRYLDGEPILARPTPQWERALKWVRRRPSTAALIVVSALSIIAAAGGGLWNRAERDRQRAAIRQRVEEVRQQASRFILLGEEAVRRKDWDGAGAQTTSALALIRTEPELVAMSAGASRMLVHCRAKIAAREARAAARARLAAFRRSYDEAVFYDSQYTGLEPEANLRASREAASQALDQFEPNGGSGHGLSLAGDAFDESEVVAISERYYELALILADARSQPIAGEDPVVQAQKSLRILDRVARVRLPTKIFFVRRADYLLRTGDRTGAEAMRSKAGAALGAEHSTVDDFLEGKAAYARHDYVQAIAALRRVLKHEPGHFWGQYLLAICQLKEHHPGAAQAALTVCQAARPGFVWTYLLKGFAEGEMDEFDLAEAEFTQAAERGLDDAARYVMLVNRGVIRVRRGWSEDAAEDFQAAIAQEPGRFQAYVNLAQAYQNLARFDQAAEVLDRAIARFPNQAVLYRARARVHRLRSHDPQALADLGHAIAIAPSHDRIALHVTPGDYFLMAQGLNGDGSSQLSTSFSDATAPSQPVSSVSGSYSVAVADFTHGNIPDVVIADFRDNQVLVYLGLGDGTFQPPVAIPVGLSPLFVTTADLLGNGNQDIITANLGSNGISILMGNGDGTFQPAIEVPAGQGPASVAVGDFYGDGRLDLAVADMVGSDVQILRNNGDGTFSQGPTIPIDGNTFSVTAGDLYGNGQLDLATVGFDGGNLTILQDQGSADFVPVQELAAGVITTSVIAADFDGTGRPELAVASAGDNTVRLFQNQGGQFVPSVVLSAPTTPFELAAADLTNDGHLDLVASSYGAGDISIFAGNGDGTFQAARNIPIGASTTALAAADLTGNGRIDLVTADLITANVYVLLGNGDGTFQVPPQPSIEPASPTVVAADLTGNGKMDLIVPDYSANDLSVFLGRGDGTFGAPIIVPTSLGPWGVAVGDFTGNGKMDLAVADLIADSISILLGNGDGTFTQGETIYVGADPSGLVAADFNDDGNTDLAVACAGSDNVVVLLGLGDGTFSSPIDLPVGEVPRAIVAGDFFHTGVTDIAVTDEISNEVAVLVGRGDGTFFPAQRYPVGVDPVALVAADLSGNGYEDLVTANRASGNLTILWALPGGTFAPQTDQYGGHAPSALTAGDFNGDGQVELAVADEQDDEITILANQGGSFTPISSFHIGEAADFLQVLYNPDGIPGVALAAFCAESDQALAVMLAPDESPASIFPVPLGVEPIGQAIGDFNNSGYVSVAMVTASSPQIVVVLGDAAAAQGLAGEVAATLPQSRPVVVDWNGAGTPDVFTLGQQGQLLLRVGEPGAPGEFEAPQVIGQDLGVRFTYIVSVQTASGPVMAALEAGQPVIWLFSEGSGPGSATIARSIQVPNAAFLVSIAAGDLQRDGLDDLVLVDRGSDQVIVLDQARSGSFAELESPLPVGYAPSNVAIADLNGNGWLDLVVSNTYSGDLSVYYGGPTGFGPEVMLAGGLGAAELVAQGNDLVRHTNDQPTGVTAGVFDASGLTDVVSVQSGADQISLLDGTPGGELADPSLATSYSTGIGPTQVVAASLTGNGLSDLVVLNQGSDDISIFLNNGKRGLHHHAPR